MKNILLFLVFFLGIASCKKSSKATSPTYASTATITGPDLTMTFCSGGYWIKINGVSSNTRFDTLPASAGITLATATFPISIKLNWHWSSSPDPCGRVVVDAAATD